MSAHGLQMDSSMTEREGESFHLIRSHGLNATQCPPLPLTWAIKSVSHTHSYVALQMLLKSTNPHLNKERTSFVVFNLQNIQHMNLLKGHARKNLQQRNLLDRHSLSSHMRKGCLYLPLLIFLNTCCKQTIVWEHTASGAWPTCTCLYVCSHEDISGLKTWF